MKINPKIFSSRSQLKQYIQISTDIKDIYTDMDTIVGQILSWYEYNHGHRDCVDGGFGYIYHIQHLILKKNHQNIEIVQDKASDIKLKEFCELYFVSLNGIFLILTTGFVDPSRNVVWKLGEISGSLLKTILISE